VRGHAVNPGDLGQILIPVNDFSNTTGVTNLQITVTTSPSWLDLFPGSNLGPVSVSQGSTYTFEIDYQYLSGVTSSDGSGTINYTVSSTGNANISCLLSTRDFFATSAYYCADSSGNPYAVVKSSDYIPPITTIVYQVAPSTSTGSTYMMRTSSISFTAVDVLLSTVPSSGVSATYYSIDSSSY
jgi:hypothetical protein